MRGKVAYTDLQRPSPGITPACAGKRNSQHTTFTSERDHPRVCGEKGGPHRAGHPPRGSPPRVRGKAEWENLIGSDVRITPACAGKRKSHSKHKKHHRDHPRVCGEKSLVDKAANKKQGSPPRVRGKVDADATAVYEGGITPACAGKSVSRGHAPPAGRDHPRVCGEKVGPVGCVSGWLGSPPRVRGKAVWKDIKHAEQGITPACAGKSGLEGY